MRFLAGKGNWDYQPILQFVNREHDEAPSNIIAFMHICCENDAKKKYAKQQERDRDGARN